MIKAQHRGSGRRLLLVHGLGGSWMSWGPILDNLAAQREVIALDLPGHGESAARPDSGTFHGLVESVDRYIIEHGLRGVDIAGASLGGRIVLELARRGGVGNVVALDPGGFWSGWERSYFRWTLTASLQVLRLIKNQLPLLSASAISRTVLLAQLSARPWALPRDLVERELTSFASTATVGPLIRNLAKGPLQQGPAAASTGRVTIGWGRKDRLCPPGQAARARAAFPQARFHWFDMSGHYPMWDMPERTAELILRSTEDGAG